MFFSNVCSMKCYVSVKNCLRRLSCCWYLDFFFVTRLFCCLWWFIPTPSIFSVYIPSIKGLRQPPNFLVFNDGSEFSHNLFFFFLKPYILLWFLSWNLKSLHKGSFFFFGGGGGIAYRRT